MDFGAEKGAKNCYGMTGIEPEAEMLKRKDEAAKLLAATGWRVGDRVKILIKHKKLVAKGDVGTVVGPGTVGRDKDNLVKVDFGGSKGQLDVHKSDLQEVAAVKPSAPARRRRQRVAPPPQRLLPASLDVELIVGTADGGVVLNLRGGRPAASSLLKLDDAGASKNLKVSRCRGLYELQSRQVNGRPTWRHIMRYDTWLACDSSEGMKSGASMRRRTQQRGSRVAHDADRQRSSRRGQRTWDWFDGTKKEWIPERSVTCDAVSEIPPPPQVLSIEGGSAVVPASVRGYYELSSRQVEGHPAWQHTVQREWWIVRVDATEVWADEQNWAVQNRVDFGTDDVELDLRDYNCLYPSDSYDSWLAYDSGWHPEPTFRCLAMTADEKVRREKAAAEEKKRLEKEAEEARLAQQRAQALADELIREEEESKQKTSAKAKKGAEAKAKREAEAKAKREAEAKAKREAEEEAAHREAEAAARREAEKQARLRRRRRRRRRRR